MKGKRIDSLFLKKEISDYYLYFMSLVKFVLETKAKLKVLCSLQTSGSLNFIFLFLNPFYLYLYFYLFFF